MTDRDEMLALAGQLADKLDQMPFGSPNTLLRRVERALRSAATPAPGYAQGFEACRSECLRVTIDEREKCAPNPGYMMAAKIRNAIAALPAPAGVEVTESDLHEFMLKHSEEWDSEEAAAQAIFSRFTILAKPAQEGQGS